jgi:microcompartment protein CcmK/EutM
MRLGTVIGRVTLTLQEPAYTGGRLVLVHPWTRAEFAAADRVPPDAIPKVPLPAGSTLVAYDELGVRPGTIVGITEGAEASQPFPGDAPVDAYVACLVQHVDYHPPA